MQRNSMHFVDTHCHIHEILGVDAGTGDLVPEKWHEAGVQDPASIVADATKDGVSRMICVGCALGDSKLAVDFVRDRDGLYASIGIHPHEAKHHVGIDEQKAFAALAKKPKVVAVGECGLDYYYTHSPKKEQVEVLRFQIELALEYNLPMIFHVRDAFDDFWPIFDDYKGIRGVIHSFSAGQKELDEILERNLYVGLNGIMTFTKNPAQLAAAKAVSSEHLLLETDAPFLTPYPYRGTICQPKHVRVVANFLAELRGESLESIAKTTTQNAEKLFNIKVT